MSIADAHAAIEARLTKAAAAMKLTHSVRYYGFSGEGCQLDASEPLLVGLGQAHTSITGMPPTYGAVTCTTDARHFTLYSGIPATCYGPEFTRNIHGIDESVSIAAVVQVSAVLAQFVADWCGVAPTR